jgi:hypothetical protein
VRKLPGSLVEGAPGHPAGASDDCRSRSRQTRRRRLQQIDRQLDEGWAGSRRCEAGESPRQNLGQLGGLEDGVSQRAQLRGEAVLIGQLVQEAAAAAELAAAIYTRDHEQGNRISPRLCERGGDVGDAGSGDREAHARTAADSSVAVRHESKTLLVPRHDVADRNPVEAAVELHIVHARYAEDVLHAEGCQAFQQVGADCRAMHARYFAHAAARPNPSTTVVAKRTPVPERGSGASRVVASAVAVKATPGNLAPA